MSRKFALGLAVALGIATAAPAQIPEASPQPNHPYAINPQAGEYVIFVRGFTGQNAPALAVEFITELRQTHKLYAYFYRYDGIKQQEQSRSAKLRQQHADFLRSMGINAADAPPPVIKQYRPDTIGDQYAILVGGYKDMDAARKALDDIRQKMVSGALPPPSKKFMDIATETNVRTNQAERVFTNPFVQAFVSHNPMIPRRPAPDADKLDPFIKQINENETYNLLKNPKRWTLVVRNYTAPIQLVSRDEKTESIWDKVGLGSSRGEALGASAMQAHQLAEVLRHPNLGFESYVLHTRGMSIVTVGGFDSPNDPKLLSMQQALSKIKLVEPLTLIPTPMPMEVPKVD